jgi:hypothetical protein
MGVKPQTLPTTQSRSKTCKNRHLPGEVKRNGSDGLAADDGLAIFVAGTADGAPCPTSVAARWALSKEDMSIDAPIIMVGLLLALRGALLCVARLLFARVGAGRLLNP